MKLILLPGLDGTGILYGPLVQALPTEIVPVVVSYPVNRQCSANELLDIVLSHLPKNEPYVLLAESFSGPLALRALVLHSQPPSALILCASFAKCPAPRSLIRLGGLCCNRFTHQRLSHWIISRLMAGNDAAPEIISLFYKALSIVLPKVLRHRFLVLCEFNNEYTPKNIQLPFLYIRATHDCLIGKRHAKILKQRHPQMLIEEIKAPHLVLQVRPNEAAQVIWDFLKKIS